MKCLLAVLPIAALIAPVPAVARPAQFTSKYTKFGGCRLIRVGERGQDWGLQQCKGYGGIPVWWVFSDSTRGYLGFGTKTNVTGTYGSNRDFKWPIEWRGHFQGGKFQPLAVIVRMDRPEGAYDGPSPTDLFVYRLRADGTSCIVGEDIKSNEEARRIADASVGEFSCILEPQKL